MGARGGGPDHQRAAPAPPGWYEDPATRHEARYWNGRGWSEHVTDAGLPAVDPADARWPGPPATVAGTTGATTGDRAADVVASTRGRTVATRHRALLRRQIATRTGRGRGPLVAGALVVAVIALVVPKGFADDPPGPGGSLTRAAARAVAGDRVGGDAGAGTTPPARADGTCSPRAVAESGPAVANGCTAGSRGASVATGPRDDGSRRAPADVVASRLPGTPPTSDAGVVRTPGTRAPDGTTTTTTSPAGPTTTTSTTTTPSTTTSTTTAPTAPVQDPVSDPGPGDPTSRPDCPPGHRTPTGCA